MAHGSARMVAHNPPHVIPMGKALAVGEGTGRPLYNEPKKTVLSRHLDS